MIKSSSRILLLIVVSFAFLSVSLYSQEEITKGQFENVLSRFVNYRFGTISLWRLKNISEVRKAIKEREQAATGVAADASVTKTVDEKTNSIVEEGVRGGDDIDDIKMELQNRGVTIPPAEVLNALYQYYKQIIEGTVTQLVESAYLVTTRPERGKIPSSIIALILSYNPASNLEKDLKQKNQSEIYTFDELRAFTLDTGYTSENMYELMVNALVQQNVENLTIQAQGIGTPGFAPQVKGVTSNLIRSEEDVVSYDIQMMERVSRGEPLDYKLNQNEVTVSPDLLSWRSYRLPVYYDNNGNAVTDSTQSTNMDLPKFGVELKYGIEEINYPSFWSERLTLSALWENVRLGMILPTNGWSSLGSDAFSQERKLTHGGVGVAGGIDFPIKVIRKSGIFQTSFGYVFGDAKEATYKNRNIDPETYTDNIYDLDYLIRANAQVHYTFGVAIDEDYLIRFGLGGTVYNVESWYNKSGKNADGDNIVSFTKYASETIGGISGRVDVMIKNVVTPFGVTAQYFDESIYTNIWLSIPVIDNTLAIRLDAKGYFNSIFRENPHPWENKSVFIPMARVIITF